MSEKKILHESVNPVDDELFIEGVILAAKSKLLLNETNRDLLKVLESLKKEKSAPK